MAFVKRNKKFSYRKFSEFWTRFQIEYPHDCERIRKSGESHVSHRDWEEIRLISGFDGGEGEYPLSLKKTPRY
jgi:hypothetical protein